MWLLVFFFKQKTAYEMRISDWSSDVCSSDLCAGAHACCQHKMAGPYWFGQARPRNGVTPPVGIHTFDGAGKQHRHTRALRTERQVIGYLWTEHARQRSIPFSKKGVAAAQAAPHLPRLDQHPPNTHAVHPKNT